MTLRELDRLVSKTELTPVSKAALRQVRRAVMKGRAQGPHMSRYTWSVEVQGSGGQGARFTFRLRRDGQNTN